jgi:hypothetical protein
MEPTVIRIYCKETNPRLAFVFHYIESQLGVNLTLQDDLRETQISYGKIPVEGKLNIYASGFLEETSIRIINPSVDKADRITILFPSPEGFDVSFDIFSAVFFMLSRYEEYMSYNPDVYGRFEADESLASRENFLEEPVVDEWILLFKKLLKVRFPDIILSDADYRFQSTIDIDNPWAFRHRGFIRNTAGLIRDTLQLKRNALRRLGSLTGLIKDPYDVYTRIRELEDQQGINSVYFFLSGGYGNFDVNYALKTRAFRKLLRTMSDDRQIGIHPSYRSNQSFEILKEEYDVFSEILGKRPEISRQHFLILKMPETYNRIISLGIKHDYSMGFASRPGFRAGTSRPFRFYDLKNEKETDLTIHPFVMMDVTLRQYLKLDVAVAMEKVTDMSDKLRSVNGLFTLLWHNESLCNTGEWKGWDRVFRTAWQGIELPDNSDI